MPSFSYDFAGFGVINATSVAATGAITADSFKGDIGVSRKLGIPVTDSTGSLTLTSGRAYAMNIDRVPEDLSSILATYYLHGVAAVAGAGGASVNWAEVAIATGTLAQMLVNTDLTVLGFTSINANAVAAATQWYGTVITASIPANTDLWLILAAAYETTQLSVRVPTNFLNARGYARTVNAFRPSLNIGTPTTFAGTVTTGTIVPIMGAQF
jgi:hypothetical protein